MDLKLVETGNGGDFERKPSGDLTIIEGFQNMIYISLFGGNPGFNTPRVRSKNQQAFDFWGNTVFANNNLSLQFNSNTEFALMTIPLTSNGRLLIEQAVKKDLQFMRPFAKVGVSVVVSGIDRVLIGIRIIQPENLQQRDFIYIWDSTRQELLSKEGDYVVSTVTPPSPEGKLFDYTFDEFFE